MKSSDTATNLSRIASNAVGAITGARILPERFSSISSPSGIPIVSPELTSVSRPTFDREGVLGLDQPDRPT
jgi:hypothetical protein